MLGRQKVHARLFYEFDLETHIPADHLLRGIDRFLDLNDLHEEMRGFYTDLGNGKRWVRIAPPGAETEILLARSAGDRQSKSIGEQGGGRVWIFLETDDFAGDYQRLQAAGVEFETPPRDEPYGRVVVWRDPWGNRWDLIEFARPDRSGTGS